MKCHHSVLYLVTAFLFPIFLSAAPVNDNFSRAIVLTGTSGSVTANNADATFEYSEIHVGDGGNIWYSFAAPSAGYLVVSYDSTIARQRLRSI